MAAVAARAKTTDDFLLMEAVAAGDATAIAALYDRHSPLVFALCLRIVRDRSEAEDLLADIFWEIWRRADRYDAARGSPLTYLLTVARSRAIDRRRSLMKRRTVQTESDYSGGASSASSSGTPLTDAITKELGEKVRAALARLDPAQRQAVEMSFFDDLSHTEIAEKLGKPLGTIKTYIRQGLIHLREFVRMD
ncbi:MAG: sigma-70 family RNA polymerase sigma factor [Tepidisphaeraceae bacterium]